MASSLPSPPLTTPLVEVPEVRSSSDPLARLVGALVITRVWYEWLTSITSRVQQSAATLTTTTLSTPATAAIAPTDLPLGTTAGGLYRVNTYMRITTPASVNSSLTVTITATDGGVVCPQSGAALITNTTASVQSNVFILRSDPAAPLTYSTAYVSGGTPMAYSLSVIVEQIG